MTEETRKKVLVLGASGRLGRLLRRCWKEGTAHGIAPVWQYRSTPEQPDGIRIETLDAPAQETVKHLAGVQAMLVLSGVTPGPGRQEADFEANRSLALAAIRLAAELDVPRVLLASSAAVYGSASNSELPLREDGPVAPLGAYGRSKLAMEEAAQALAVQIPGLSVTSLRIANVAGADQLLGPGRRPVTLDAFSDGQTPRRSYLGPAAFARILADVICHGDRLPACLNMTSPAPVAMGDLLRAGGFAVSLRPAPPGLLRQVDLDSTRLSGIVPLQPEDGCATGIVRDWQRITGGNAV